MMLTLALITAGAMHDAPVWMTCEGTASYPATTMALPYGMTSSQPGPSIRQKIEIRRDGYSLRVKMPAPMTPLNYLRRVDVEIEAQLEGASLLLGRGTMIDDSSVTVALDQQSGGIEMKGRHGSFSGRCVDQQQ